MIGWAIEVMCPGQSSFRKVTHSSTVLALGGSLLEFPWAPS